ncbi:MAG: MOSC domain-containing protein [Candidatus Dormibacteria bacterium]
MLSSPAGRLRSVNVGQVRTLRTAKRQVPSAIVKAPVPGRVAVRGVNLAGDDQADRRYHGGPDQVLYAYAAEDYAWWEAELGRPLAPGTFGENLTVEGIEVSGALIGESWRVGRVRVQVTGPRIPCFKLAARLGDPLFVKRFLAARRTGAYLRVLEEGDLAADDPVTVLSRPGHGVTVTGVVDASTGRLPAESVLAAPELASSWRSWAEQRRAQAGT